MTALTLHDGPTRANESPSRRGAATTEPDPGIEEYATAGRVVVGVDDGRPSREALRWALRAAARHGWVVDVVTVWPDREAVFIHEVPGHPNHHRHRAVESQRRALADVVDPRSPEAHVRTFVENARPADALVAHSRGASLLVVGAPGPPARPPPRPGWGGGARPRGGGGTTTRGDSDPTELVGGEAEGPGG